MMVCYWKCETQYTIVLVLGYLYNHVWWIGKHLSTISGIDCKYYISKEAFRVKYTQ